QQVTNENGLFMQTYYVLHTGASWHGPIGRAAVLVNFAPGTLKGPIRMMPINTLSEMKLQSLKWPTLPARTVVYEGPCKPVVQGRTLRFVRAEFRPEKKDDIHLHYAWRKLTNM